MEQALSEIHEDDIEPNAAKVVRRLTRHGFEAYLVGGCVRDLLMGRTPKDFDVATSATPAEIKKLFRNCRIIGRRFQLAHIFFGQQIIETSTFRAPPPAPDNSDQTEIIRRDNIFGTAEEDARRRDFTINGLFFDLRNNRVIDHVGGVDDLRARRVRTIGDPRVRIQEDPVRIIRAVKFAARLNIEIDPATRAAMVEFRGLIAQCSVARVLEEIFKLLASGAAAPTFRLMHETGVLAVLFPELQELLAPPDDPMARAPAPPVMSRVAPPANHDSPPEVLPRDAEPESPVAPQPPAVDDGWQEELEEIARLVQGIVGEEEEERARAAQWCWSHLEGLDQLVRRSPEAPPSRPLMLAAALMGPAARSVTDLELPIGRAMGRLERLIGALAVRLRVSRKDRERIKQILIAQRRFVHRGRRSRPSSMIRREYFPEAWQLFELSCSAATGREEDLERWRQLLGGEGKGGAGKRRRRRRRRRDRSPRTTEQGQG